MNDYNLVLKRIKVALSLTEEQVGQIFELGRSGPVVSPSEYRGYLQSIRNKNYRRLEYSILLEFLDGLIQYKRSQQPLG